jgi:hypothetical protein
MKCANKEASPDRQRKPWWVSAAVLAPTLLLYLSSLGLDSKPTYAQTPRTSQESAIIGGRPITDTELINEYKGLPVAIQYFLEEGSEQRIFGGTGALAAKLVASDTVRVLLVTAAHLWQLGNGTDGETITWDKTACVGHADLRQCNDSDGQRVAIEDAYVHKLYSEENGEPHHDLSVATVVLSRTVFSKVFGKFSDQELAAGVKLAYLGGDTVIVDGQEVRLSAENPISGTETVVIGGGRQHPNKPAVNGLLQIVTQTVYSNEFMQQILGLDFDGETMLGVGDHTGATDSCIGDSGMPFLIEIADGKWQIVAVVSWGKTGCAIPGNVAVNSRTNHPFYIEARNDFLNTGFIVRNKEFLPIAQASSSSLNK